MNSNLTPSAPFQKLCGECLPSIRIFSDAPILFCLGVFLHQRLKAVLNDGSVIEGTLQRVSSDSIEIDGKRILFPEMSRWLSRCEVGIATGIDQEMVLLRIVPCSTYGIDHHSAIYVTINGHQLSDFDVASLNENGWGREGEGKDCPILYGSDSDGGIEVFGTGAMIPKVHFGTIVKYHQDLGAGQIAPQNESKMSGNHLLRFVAEDLTNTSPTELNTFTFQYRVSYTISFLHDHSEKATNIYKINSVHLDQLVPLPDAVDPMKLLSDTKEAASRHWNVSSEIIELEPLPEGRHYGLLFYFLPTFHIVNLYSFYKYKAIYGDLTPEESRDSRLVGIPKSEDTFSPEESVDTRENVYLVSYGSDSRLTIHTAYEKKNFWLFQIAGNKMLVVHAPWDERKDENEEDNVPEVSLVLDENNTLTIELMDKPDEIITLPMLKNPEECYAVLNYYARSKRLVFFHRAFVPGLSSDQIRQLTLAVATNNELSVIDSEASFIAPDAAFNTMRYVYIVKLSLGDTLTTSGAPFIQGPVTVVRSFVRKNYRGIEIAGNSINLYGSTEVGIVQQGHIPQESIYPSYIDGETLILQDANGQHTIAYSEQVYLPTEDEGIVYRFGILTKLYRDPDGYALLGGCLNHGVYFTMENMGEQARNMIQTSPKRMLLLYFQRNNSIIVDRVLPQSIWDIPWEKDMVSECTVSASELTITTDSGIRHFQTTDTDGYVNSSARNGSLKNNIVFLKRVVCPNWKDKYSPKLMQIAASLHCEQEMAFISYDQDENNYYAWRYNLRTKILGTIRRTIYGSEKTLSASVNHHKEITFIPYGDNGTELLPVLPSIGEENPSDMRMPSITHIESSVRRTDGSTYMRAENTCIGKLMLRVAGNSPRYRKIYNYVVNDVLPENETDETMELECRGVFSSTISDDLFIAAKLLEDIRSQSAILRFLNTLRGPQNPNYYLRRAFRSRINEIIQNGNYWIGEFNAYMLPILDSDFSREQRARDLYVFFLSSFSKRYDLKNEVLSSITASSFVSEKEPDDQEFVVKLRELFCEDDSDVYDASQLYVQMMALDQATFDFLCDILRNYISQPLRNDLLAECGSKGGAKDDSHLFVSLQEKRRIFVNKKEQCRHILIGFAHHEESGMIYSAITGQINLFHAIMPFLDPNDYDVLRELLKACQNVDISSVQPYADRMSMLESIQTSIGMLRSRTAEHPSPVIVDLFSSMNLLERIHGEIIEIINDMCQDANSLPDVRCVCNFPVLVPNQSDFTLNLENGDVESDGGSSSKVLRTARDLKVSFFPREGISSDNVSNELDAGDNDLASGNRLSLRANINLEGIPVRTTIRIGYVIHYQYLDSVQFDASRMYMNRSWKSDQVKGDLTLFVDEAPKELIDRKHHAENPYAKIKSIALDANSKMYFGRTDEQKSLLTYLRDGGKHLIRGKTVLLYGQKQCGKTSFLNRIVEELSRDPEAIILSYDDIYSAVCDSNPLLLPDFRSRLSGKLLTDLVKKLREISNPELQTVAVRYDSILRPLDDDLRDEHLVEKLNLFSRLLDDFRQSDLSKYKIVLVMDEFTRLCMGVLASMQRNPVCRTVPEFIRTYSDKGFIQIIVGHASMMELFDELNVINRTAQTAKIMQLSNLDSDSARAMICKPMEDSFGVGVYDTPSGITAVSELEELSGKNPYYLVYLCDHMFEYYQLEAKLQMSREDVHIMVSQLPDAEIGRKYPLFDPLLAEDSDDPETRTRIFEYLSYIAEQTYEDQNHSCDRDTVCPSLDRKTCYRIRDILIARNVLIAEQGNIRINVGLFREHVRRIL